MYARVLARSFIPLTRLNKMSASHNTLIQYSPICAEKITLCSGDSIIRSYSERNNLDHLTVGFDEVKKATSDKKILIIDVREPEELKEYGRIPNSINIPLGSVTSVLSTMPEDEFEKVYSREKPVEDTEIIFFCMIGKRSGMAQQNAFNLGYKNAKNYLGSWNDWASKV